MGMRKESRKDAAARFMLEPELPSVAPLPRLLLLLLLLLLLASSPATPLSTLNNKCDVATWW